MPRLYDLATELDELVDRYNNVETDEELDAILQQLLAVDESFEQKLESCCRIIKNYDVDIDGFKAEIARLTKTCKAAEARQDSLKRYTKDCMKQSGKLKLKVGIFTPRVQVNSRASVAIAESIKPEDIPTELRIWNPPCDGFWSFDRDAIEQRWKMQQAWVAEFAQTNGRAPEAAEIPEALRIPEGITVERGDHLRIG